MTSTYIHSAPLHPARPPSNPEVTIKEVHKALSDLNRAIERVYVRAGGPEYSELMTAQGQARLLLKRMPELPARIKE